MRYWCNECYSYNQEPYLSKPSSEEVACEMYIILFDSLKYVVLRFCRWDSYRFSYNLLLLIRDFGFLFSSLRGNSSTWGLLYNWRNGVQRKSFLCALSPQKTSASVLVGMSLSVSLCRHCLAHIQSSKVASWLLLLLVTTESSTTLSHKLM